jgi:hypothetical protein
MGVLSSDVKQLVHEAKTLSPFEVLNVWSFTFMSLLCIFYMVLEDRNSLTSFDPSSQLSERL